MGCTPATSAKQNQKPPRHVAKVADVAAPWPENGKSMGKVKQSKTALTPQTQHRRPVYESGDSTWPHGTSISGRPLTWTGKVVDLAAWRDMTEWERHGPNGKHCNGKTMKWERQSLPASPMKRETGGESCLNECARDQSPQGGDSLLAPFTRARPAKPERPKRNGRTQRPIRFHSTKKQ